MRCGLVCSSLLSAVVGGVALVTTAAPAAPPLNEVPNVPAVRRFLAIDYGVSHQATHLRLLEASNDRLSSDAWMDVRTAAEANGFRYTVLDEGGSGFVRNRALRGALDQESQAWKE